MSLKRAVVLLVVILSLGGATVAANRYQVRRNANRMLELAREARIQQNRADALSLYESYLNFQPRDVDAIVEYTGMLEEDTNPKARRAQIDAFERLLRVAPHRAEERGKLVALYMTYQMFPSAKHHLEYLLDPNSGTPEDAERLNQLATCEFRLGRVNDGIAILKKLVATRKAEPVVYQKLAEALRSERTVANDHESEAVMEQLTRDLANNTEARVVRIRYLIQSQRVEEAKKEIASAVKQVQNPEKSPEFSLLAAEYFANEKQFDSARIVLARAISENPKHPQLRIAIYQILDQLRDKAKADEQLKMAIELSENNNPNTIDLLDLMIDKRDLELARREIDRRYKGKESFRPVHDYLVGRLELQEGNWPEARKRLEGCLEFFEKQPAHFCKAQTGLGQCFIIAQNPERALEAFSRASLAYPAWNQAQLGRADALIRLNRLKEAEPILREFADAIPAARSVLAETKYIQQMSQPAALRDWTQVHAAIGKPPFSVGLEVLQARILVAQGKAEDAEKSLLALIKRAGDAAEARVALAELVARRSTDEAQSILQAGEQVIGDLVVFRIANAALAAKDGNLAKVKRLAENAEFFSPDDRITLYRSLAERLAAHRQYNDAIVLVQRVASERPYDLTSRLQLIQFHLQSQKFKETAPILNELKHLDGENGPLYQFALILTELAQLKMLDREQANTFDRRLVSISSQREAWTRPYVVRGELALRIDDSDAALNHFRKAYSLGERDEYTFRTLVELLIERGRYDEAFVLLDNRDKISGIPNDLIPMHAILEASRGVESARSIAIVKQTESTTNPRIQLFRGHWFLIRGELRSAILAFEKANSLAPELTEAWLARIRILKATDRDHVVRLVQDLPSVLEKVRTKILPQSRIALTLGQAHELVDDSSGAVAIYRKGLLTDPTDRGLMIALSDLLRRQAQHSEADQLCKMLLAQDDDDARRWARRGLAQGVISRSPSLKSINEAIELIETNLKPVSHREDVRLKAFIMARDPFRRIEAHKLLEESSIRDPLTVDERVQRAALFLQEGRLNEAEADLREATIYPMSSPAHLISLHQIQIQQSRFEAARTTRDRLQKLIPNSWELIRETARALIAQKKKFEALKILKEYPESKNPDFSLLQIAPFLSESGCTQEAEAMIRDESQRSRRPDRKTYLVRFLIEHGRSLEAIRTISELTNEDCPAPYTRFNLMKNAIAVRPREAITENDRAEWDRLVAHFEQQLNTELLKSPKDAHLIFAKAAVSDAKGDIEGSIREYERGLALDPQNVICLNNLATLKTMSSPDAARHSLELINRALDIAGPRGHLLDSRAMIYLSMANTTEAYADLTAARLTGPRAVYDFHAALVADSEHQMDRRKNFANAAKSKGLTKFMLHPREWQAYERIYGPE